MVNAHLGVAGDVSHSEARQSLKRLMDFNVQVATDPACNGGKVLIQAMDDSELRNVIRGAVHDTITASEMASFMAVAKAVQTIGRAAAEPKPYDVLPPIGSRVYIRYDRDNDAHACTVTGYYAWSDMGGNRRLHRVFARLVYEGTEAKQSRMLCDCYPTEAEALAGRPDCLPGWLACCATATQPRWRPCPEGRMTASACTSGSSIQAIFQPRSQWSMSCEKKPIDFLWRQRFGVIIKSQPTKEKNDTIARARGV